MASLKIWIGTSGWSYAHWSPVFYPEELPQKDWLHYYARYFSTVEVNMTFYRFPPLQMVQSWVKKTPETFLFSLKMHRHITHLHRLKGNGLFLESWLERLAPLEKKLGVILIQLPPALHCDPELLKNFLALLPSPWRYALEFRHPSWEREEVYELLSKKGIARCTLSHPRYPFYLEPTAPFVYIRMHGSERLYCHCYSEKELRKLAQRVRKLPSTVKEVFVYFNNDAEGFAVENALALKKLLHLE